MSIRFDISPLLEREGITTPYQLGLKSGIHQMSCLDIVKGDVRQLDLHVTALKLCEFFQVQPSAFLWYEGLPRTYIDWLPISQAPKDGEDDLLLFYVGYGAHMGHWCPDRYVKEPRPYWKSDLTKGWGADREREVQPILFAEVPWPTEGQISAATAD